MLHGSIQVIDLVGIILFIMAVVVAALLVVVLLWAIKILYKVDTIVSENKDNINELFTVLPVAITSLNDGVQSIKSTVDSAGETIGYISENVVPKGKSFIEDADGIIDIVKIIGEVARAAIHYFKKEEE